MSVGPQVTTRVPEAIVPPPTVWQLSNDSACRLSVDGHGWPACEDAAGASSSSPTVGATTRMNRGVRMWAPDWLFDRG
jgi:hypothetical protein